MPQPCKQAHERRLHRHELLVRRRWPPHLDQGIGRFSERRPRGLWSFSLEHK